MSAKLKAFINTIKELVADPQEIVTKVAETVGDQNNATDTTMSEEQNPLEELENVAEETQEEIEVLPATKEKITPFKIFAAIFNGVGVGVLLGLLLGLAVSPVVSGFIGALSSILGLLLGLSEKLLSPIKSIRIGAFGLSCVIGILFGIFVRTNNFLSPKLQTLKDEYIALGYTEKEALSFISFQEFGLVEDEWIDPKATHEEEEPVETELVDNEAYKATESEEVVKIDKDGNTTTTKIVKEEKPKEKTVAIKTVSNTGGKTLLNAENNVVQNRRASVLFSSDVEVGQCYILDMTDESLDTEKIINNFKVAGETWGKIAKNIDKNLSNDEDKKKALLLTKNAFCEFEGTSSVTLKNCKDIDLAASTTDIEKKLKENGAPWSDIVTRAQKEISQDQYKSYLISITNSICDEEDNK